MLTELGHPGREGNKPRELETGQSLGCQGPGKNGCVSWSRVSEEREKREDEIKDVRPCRPW